MPKIEAGGTGEGEGSAVASGRAVPVGRGVAVGSGRAVRVGRGVAVGSGRAVRVAGEVAVGEAAAAAIVTGTAEAGTGVELSRGVQPRTA